MQQEASGYRNRQVYERSYKAALAVYEMTKSYPEEEKNGVRSQKRRAGKVKPLNSAEGYAKRRSQEGLKRFLLMAVGSANEMSVLLDFAKDLGYTSESTYAELSRAYDEIGRMLSSFIKRIQVG